jgi:photosystem II stability/assembly factor-like uncharacterized protein
MVAAGLLAGLVAGPRAADANGRFPRTVKLVSRPGHPQEMALGVTFGLLVTRDGGQHWQWMCESAIGFEGTFDPDYEVTPAGTMLATTFDGTRITRDGGCHWDLAPAPLGDKYMSVLAVGGDGAVYAASPDANDPTIYKSTDDAVSFAPTGAVGMRGDWWSSIEVAPGDPRRIYLAGFRGMGAEPRQRILFRSTDGGQSWTQLPTTMLIGTDVSELQIAAISPLDPDRVLMRMTLTAGTLQETLYLSEDAGTDAPAGPTWTKVMELADLIPGVVVRRDRSVWVATQAHGLHRSTDGGRTFTPVGVEYDARCLTEREDGVLFLCANDLPPDERALASSTTGAAGTWTPRLRFADIAAPLACEVGTVQRDDCQAIVWCGIKQQLGITSDVVECLDPSDAGVDAGTTGPPGKTCCDTGGAPPVLELSVVLIGLWPGWRRRRAQRTRR